MTVLRLTDNRQELAHAEALPLRVAGASPVGYADKGGLCAVLLSGGYLFPHLLLFIQSFGGWI